MLRRSLETLFLPPASVLLLFLLGALLARKWRRPGRTLQVLAGLWLWLAATPAFAGVLLGSLQSFPALPATGSLPAAEAIVVLSAESDPVGAEFGGPVAGAMT
ncbi:MAG: YdcF family protein, partial [Planctomycetota bacterium]